MNSHMVRNNFFRQRSTCMQNNLYLVFFLLPSESVGPWPSGCLGTTSLLIDTYCTSLWGHPGEGWRFPSCAPNLIQGCHIEDLHSCLSSPWLIFIVNPIYTSNTNFVRVKPRGMKEKLHSEVNLLSGLCMQPRERVTSFRGYCCTWIRWY